MKKLYLIFTFASINTAGVISGTNITVDVPFGTNIANLIATFSTSPLSKVNIVGTPQVSNLTANNFSLGLGENQFYTISSLVATTNSVSADQVFGQVLELWGFLCTFSTPLKIVAVPSLNHFANALKVS